MGYQPGDAGDAVVEIPPGEHRRAADLCGADGVFSVGAVGVGADGAPGDGGVGGALSGGQSVELELFHLSSPRAMVVQPVGLADFVCVRGLFGPSAGCGGDFAPVAGGFGAGGRGLSDLGAVGGAELGASVAGEFCARLAGAGDLSDQQDQSGAIAAGAFFGVALSGVAVGAQGCCVAAKLVGRAIFALRAAFAADFLSGCVFELCGLFLFGDGEWIDSDPGRGESGGDFDVVYGGLLVA